MNEEYNYYNDESGLQEYNEAFDQKQETSPDTILTLGILSLLLGGIPGLIMSIIARSKAKSFVGDDGVISDNFVRVGNILALCGLINSIISIAAVTLVLIFYAGLLGISIFAGIVGAVGA